MISSRSLPTKSIFFRDFSGLERGDKVSYVSDINNELFEGAIEIQEIMAGRDLAKKGLGYNMRSLQKHDKKIVIFEVI